MNRLKSNISFNSKLASCHSPFSSLVVSGRNEGGGGSGGLNPQMCKKVCKF